MRITGTITLNLVLDLAPPNPPSNVKGTLNMSTATITWVDPTARSDGSPLSAAEIVNIEVFDSAASDPTVPIGIVAGGVQTFTTGTLTVGVHSFDLVCTDTTGHQSAPSGTASVTVQATLAPPNPPSNVVATLNP